MLDFNQIKIEDVFKKTNNLIILVMVLLAIFMAFRINAKNSHSARILLQKINTQKSKDILASQIDTLLKDIQVYKKEIFFEKDSAAMLNLINEWARSSGLDLISLRPLPVERSNRFFYYSPISLEAKGDYFNLGQFLSLAEGYPGFIDITNLQISKEPGKVVNLGRLNISISLNAVSLKEPDLSEHIAKK